MKYILLLVVLFIITPLKSECQINYLSYLSYTYSHENFDDENLKNHSIGYEIFFDFYKNYDIQTGLLHWFGVSLEGLNNNNKIDLKYNLTYGFPLNFIVFNIGPGIDTFYSINKYFFGISPRIDLIISFIFVKINLFYRYNICFNNIKSHEYGLIFSLVTFTSINYAFSKG